MERICRVLQGLKPALLMVLVQVAFAAVNVLYKLAADDGMSLKIIVAYRFIFATAFMAPLAFIVERFGLLICIFNHLSQAATLRNIIKSGDSI